jgi:hypothetical protein
MALYKEHTVDGGTITLNMDQAGVVVVTNEAVWFWDKDGMYVKVNIENGSPVTRMSDVNKDGGRSCVRADWADKVIGK